MKGAGRGSPRRLPDELERRGRIPRKNRTTFEHTTCERKREYRTAADANAATMLFNEEDRVGLRAYLCPDCRMWHLGHSR